MKKIDEIKKGDIVTIVFLPLRYKEEGKIVETKVLEVTDTHIYTENARRYIKDEDYGIDSVSTLYLCTKDEYFKWEKEYDEKHKTIKERIREILNEE